LDPFHGLLARGVDLRDRDRVGCRERAGDRRGEVARPRVEVRLEEHEQPAAVRFRACRRERRGDLAGVMAVVVEEADAVRLPARLEPPARTAELREDALRLLTRDAREL